MKRVDIASAKLSVVFPERNLPAIDPANPAFVLVLGGMEIHAKVKIQPGTRPDRRKSGTLGNRR